MLKMSTKIIAVGFCLALAAAALPLSMPVGAEPAPAPRSELDAFLWPGTAPPRRLDQHGDRLQPESLRDRLVVVSFVHADCTIACAVRVLDLDKLARALPAPLRERVTFLSIGTDPDRDDPARLRAFAEGLVGKATRLRFLDSDAASTAALAAALRYPPAALPEPPPTILVFDRTGRMAMAYGSDPLDGPRLLQDLTLLETFENGIGRPARGAVRDPA